MAGNKNSGHRRDKDKMLVSSLAREYTREALDTLHHLMHNAEEGSVRKAAADSLLDRGWGKPAQAIAHTDADGDNLPPTTYIMNINGVPKK